MNTVERFPSLAAFYAADDRRAGPREVEFGGQWLDSDWDPPWRVCWIEATGEVYAVRCRADVAEGEVELLGSFGSRADVERALRGWPRVEGVRGSMPWVRRRVADLGEPGRP
jgi:hypothetical protein